MFRSTSLAMRTIAGALWLSTVAAAAPSASTEAECLACRLDLVSVSATMSPHP
jgi:hypothetical protein